MSALRWILGAALATTLVLAAAAVLAQEASAPQWKVGDTWRFRETDLLTKNEVGRYSERVQALDGASFWLRMEGSKNYWWRGDAARAARLEQFAFAAEQPQQRGAAIGSADGGFAWRWPMKVGDSFDCTENVVFPNGWKLKYELKCSVEAAETVEVPAGKFEALRIAAKGSFTNSTNGSTGRHERVFWYAPAARTDVRREYRTWLQRGGSGPYRVEGHELVEFTPGS